MESFYSARKRADKRRTLTIEPVKKIETVQISTLACWLFLSQIFDKKNIQTIRKPGSDFNVMTIDKKIH